MAAGLLCVAVLGLVPCREVRAGECAAAAAADETPQGKAFERLKALQGNWTMAGPQGPMTVTYRLISAGNVLHETLFPGTPHEMVTMYHRDGADLVLTHYCAAGNEPHLKLEPGADPATLSFRFVGAANLGKPTDGHMHDLVVRFVDADHFQAAWTFFKDGQASETKTFDWARVAPTTTVAEAPAAPMDQAAAEAAMMKAAEPGEGHAVLKPLIGRWTSVTTSWMGPGTEPQRDKGSSEATWVLGGRFVHESAKAVFGKMKFEGTGYTGYDNQKKKYVAVWMDSFGTMIMMLTGDYDATAGTLTFTGPFDDPVTGKTTTFKQVIRLVDDKHHVSEMYFVDAAGAEFKTMEVAYTRR